MRTANPALNEETFSRWARPSTSERAMTVQGTINKTGLLFVIAALTASYTWKMVLTAGDPAAAAPWIIGGALGGFVVALVLSFKPAWSALLAPIYAALEGLFLGGISAATNKAYPGLAAQAVLLTLGVMGVMLFLYKTRIIQATPGFIGGVVAATGAICLVYLASMLLGMFGIAIPYIHEGGMIGIGFSLFVVGLAALNLILDFHLIETGSSQGAPKYMEWYAAFGLMVTLVWLYIEILRLLAKLQSRRD